MLGLNVDFTSDSLLATTDPALPAPTTIKSYSGRTFVRLMVSFDSHFRVSIRYVNDDSNNGGYSERVDVILYEIINTEHSSAWYENEHILIVIVTQIKYA